MKINKQTAVHGIPVYITIIICCILILSNCTIPATPSQPPTSTSPAKFEVTSLAVTPIVALPGQAVTIEVEVTNTGGTEGFHTLTLTVNGVEEETKDVIIAPRATETATFTLVRDASGMYNIEVAGLTETLRVKQPGAYPRLANLYSGPNAFYWSPTLARSGAQRDLLLNSLAQWDLIVVHYDVIRSAPDSIQFIRKQNPQAKILAYIEAGTGVGGDGW